jgi:hypothetical protein
LTFLTALELADIFNSSSSWFISWRSFCSSCRYSTIECNGSCTDRWEFTCTHTHTQTFSILLLMNCFIIYERLL